MKIFVVSICSIFLFCLFFPKQVQCIDFSLEEARAIWHVESLTDKYKKSNSEEKNKILDNLVKLYNQNRESFVGIVIINGLLEIGELDVIKEDKSKKFPLIFGEKIQNSSTNALSFIGETKDPGLKQFLESWLVFRGDEEALTEEIKLHNRQALTMREYIQISNHIANMTIDGKYDYLFNIIDNWNTVMEYEAVILLISEEYETNPTPILNRLIELFKTGMPKSVPPPYNKDHTKFHILCILAKTLNDKKLVEVLEPLAESENTYISKNASDALSWIIEKIRYPLKYNNLYISFNSRS